MEIIQSQSEINIRGLDLLDQDIYRQFNKTKASFSFDRTVMDFFEMHVEKNPQKIAVIFKSEALTYMDLNEKANAVANKLLEMGVRADEIIPIWMHRSKETIIAVFGVLKAGAAYLPLDIHSPLERILYMLGNAQARYLLSTRKEREIVGFKGAVLYLDDEEVYENSKINPQRRNTVNDLAYVCYTSGTTGFPKGVQIEHHSLMNRIEWAQAKFPLDSKDCLFQKTPFSFDVSVWELFWWAIAGASVVLLPPGKEQDPKTITKLIEKHQITVVHFVPSMLQVFLDYLSYQPLESVSSLRWIFSSGEVLTPHSVRQFHQIYENENKKAYLVNLYGPTEATIDVSYSICLPARKYCTISIGKPIYNTRLYVIADSCRVAKIDESGELYIAGEGLARGYLNDDVLTNEKFINIRFLLEKKLYKTGDLVKLTPEGELLYLGRLDNQIKLRGLRIELDEITIHLNQNLLVKNSAVLVLNNDEQNLFLAACIVLNKKYHDIIKMHSFNNLGSILEDIKSFEGGQYETITVFGQEGEISDSQHVHQYPAMSEYLKKYLSARIPLYMIPQQYYFFNRFPMNANGKIDKRKLQELVI